MNNGTSESLTERLERLRGEIKRYYNVYFSELRAQLKRPDLFSEVLPNYLKGYKRVISVGGQDGLVAVHFPIEHEITLSETGSDRILLRFPSVQDAKEDVYDFITFPQLSVKTLVEIFSSDEDIGAVVPPEVSHERPWGTGLVGVFPEPQLKADTKTGDLTWQAPWTRLYFADFNHLDFWENLERAKTEARLDIEPYVRRAEYVELDEIRAPRSIEEAGVKAGAKGIVVEVFEDPHPALLVEYADYLGQTIALVVYSTNLEEIYDVLQDRDSLVRHKKTRVSNETPQEQYSSIPIPAHSPPLKGLVAA